MTKTHAHSSTDIVERLLSDEPLPFCPYDRRSPEYWTAPDDKPCAVCGGLNEIDAPNLCRGADTRIMKEAANEIERLRAISANAETADSEAFRDALEQLAAVARTAVSYVDYANYSKREREAQSWIRKKHEELLALAALPRLSAETAIAALAKRFWSIHPSTLDDLGLTREEFYASEMVKLFGALTRNEPPTASMMAPREMYAMLYLHDWDPPKAGQEHRWEPGKNVFPAIHGVYETIRDANAVLSRMSDPKKYWVCRVWLPAHDTPALTRPQSNTGAAS